jgi:hypothetical protein
MKTKYIKLFLFSTLLTSQTSLASLDVGYIDGTSHYAKVCHDVSCSTYGSINFSPTQTSTSSPVVITDTSVTGYIWGDELGWINLAPTGAGVTVDPNTGILYGTAFSQSSGWINFRPTNGGVIINANGELSGYAWNGGSYGGWIKFDCSDLSTCVKTNWRSIPHRTTTTVSSPGSSYFSPVENKIILTPTSSTASIPEIITTPIKSIESQTKADAFTIKKPVGQVFNSPTKADPIPGSSSALTQINAKDTVIPESNNKISKPVENIKAQSLEKNKSSPNKIIQKIKSSSYLVVAKVQSLFVFGWGSLFSFIKIF